MELLLGCGRMFLWLLGRMLTTAYWLPMPLYEQHTWEVYVGAIFLILLLGVLWKRIYPLDVWALWMLMALIPFALLTEGTTDALLAGPSRYLYLATGGWVVVLGWSLVGPAQWIGRHWKVNSNYVLAGVLAPLLLSSYVSLKKVEALSFYISSRYYIAEAKTDEGIAQMQRALDHAPDVLPLEEAYGRFIPQLFGTGEDVGAVIEEALAIFPDNAAFITYSYILESVSPDSATRTRGRQNLNEIRKRMPREKLRDYIELVAISYHNIGVGLYNKYDMEGAIRAYYRALEIAPDRLKTLKELAATLFELRRLEKAQALIPLGPQAQAGDSSALYLSALGATLKGSIDEAITLCRHALDLAPSGELFDLVGFCYGQLGQYERAAAALEEGIRLKGKNVAPPTYKYLGNFYRQSGHFDEAVRAYRAALDLDPGHLELYSHIGSILRAHAGREAVVQFYLEALQQPHLPSLVYTHIGLLLYEAEQREAAMRALRLALQRDGRNRDARINLAWPLYLDGKVEEAIAQSHRVLDEQIDLHALFNLGLFHLASGHLEQARTIYAEAIQHFGAPAAVEIGVVDDLNDLIAAGVQAGPAREVLNQYWPP